MVKLLPFFALISVLVGVSTTHAEELARGRLPDGSAFRTDVEGNQIIDYIAELEVRVEALQRQVKGLESEVSTRDQALSRLKRTGTTAAKISERDLGGAVGEARVRSAGTVSTEEFIRVENRLIDVELKLQEREQELASLSIQLGACELPSKTLRTANQQTATKTRTSRTKTIGPDTTFTATVPDPVAVSDLPRISPVAPSEMRASLRPEAPHDGLGYRRQTLRSELLVLSDLIRRRDALLKHRRQKTQSEITLRTIETLSPAIEQAHTISEIAAAANRVRELRGKIREEISE